MTNIANTI